MTWGQALWLSFKIVFCVIAVGAALTFLVVLCKSAHPAWGFLAFSAACVFSGAWLIKNDEPGPWG